MSNVIRLNPDASNQSKNSAENSVSIQIQSKHEVEKIRRGDSGFPMIFIKGRGYLHRHANGFLLARYDYPTFINEELEQATLATIQNYADHIRQWLNGCALTDTCYLHADYDYMIKILTILRENGVSEDSLSQYISTWRLFYQYLDKKEVPHNMVLPKKIKKTRMLEEAAQAGDFLNYTRKNNSQTVTQDPLIDAKRKKKRSSYISQVLTKEQMRELISELRQIDPVYGVMAKVQFDTCLRISELVKYFPHTSNELNPDFKSYGEMYIEGESQQKLKFKGKGQVDREIDLDIRTLQLIEDKYLNTKRENSDISLYSERKHLFLTKYLSSKHGKKNVFSHDSDVLWLNKEGYPVSNGMYQDAFREAANKLKKRGVIPKYVHVRPHAMRHTGATLRLVKYREETSVDIHVDNDGDIHAFLQDLLGHTKMETTHRYIRTVRDKTFGNLASKTIIRNEELWEDELSKNPVLNKGVEAIKAGIGKRPS